MRNFIVIIATLLGFAAYSCGNSGFAGTYSGKCLDHVAFPMGGLGAGMICVEGTGALSQVSLFHHPDLFREPLSFSSIYVEGCRNGAKVLEGPVPDYKIFGRQGAGMGSGGTSWGLPRFSDCSFTGRFPFARVELKDKDIPLKVGLTAWSPFVPNDEDASSLPVAVLEYSFTNTSGRPLNAVYTFSTENFLKQNKTFVSSIENIDRGFRMSVSGPEEWNEGHIDIFTNCPETVVGGCWFRGGWFDALTMEWNKIIAGTVQARDCSETSDGASGASLCVPLSLQPGQTKTVCLNLVWYVPTSRLSHYDCEVNKGYDPPYYEPWYSHRFASIDSLSSFWRKNCASLRERSARFSDTFFSSTLPEEVLDAAGSSLSILKSPTVLRQHDGRLYGYEGSRHNKGACAGTTTHVWNYAQAIPHLFPRLERTLRETEFFVAQNEEGHQVFRVALPIRPTKHSFHAAADGQLGGIVKVYRDWRISGDDEWLRHIFPKVKESLEYCIRTWDPDRRGVMAEPQHNTYDIEFWGPNGMIMSFYAAALDCFVAMSDYLGQDSSEYAGLLALCREYVQKELWNGEYFQHNVVWEGLRAGSPVDVKSYQSNYSPEALEILRREGPKYQYGSGCLTDGVLGCWMALSGGREEPLDRGLVKAHLLSVYKYNFKDDLSDHACTQRPGYGCRHDAGTLICSWPHGGKPELPFIYCDEVWTGIEYQAAAHLIFEGEVKKGLEMVRAVRSRYDGSVRNPYNEYEWGNYYTRSMASYSLLQALTGVRYDAVEKIIYMSPRIGGDFTTFLSTAFGYASVGIRGGKPFVDIKEGDIPIEKIVVL